MNADSSFIRVYPPDPRAKHPRLTLRREMGRVYMQEWDTDCTDEHR